MREGGKDKGDDGEEVLRIKFAANRKWVRRTIKNHKTTQ